MIIPALTIESDYAAMIAEFSSNIQKLVVDPTIMNVVKVRLIDTIGCMRGAFDKKAVVNARQTALKFSTTSPNSTGATVVGSGEHLTVEAAAFVNCVAARYLDFNDIYLSKEAVHPSDNIPAAMALAQALGSTGAQLLAALATGYEVHCRLADAVSTRAGRWDNVILGAIASSVMAGSLLRLTAEQQIHAINIAASGNTALMQTRIGSLSMWKAAAAAYAARAGIFAAISAYGGMSGPALALNGSHGLFKQVTGLPVEGIFDFPIQSFHLIDTHLKAWSSQYFTQTAISAALDIRTLIDLEKIKKITVSTFEFGRVAAADSPDKWLPKTRETADHSMPYCVAVALHDGSVNVASFDESALRRPEIIKILECLEVEVNPDYTASYPNKVPTGILIEQTDGRVIDVAIDFPLGHSKKPMSDEEVAIKFFDLSGTSDQMSRLLNDLNNLFNLDGENTSQLIHRSVIS